MNHSKLPQNNHLRCHARTLRKNMTPQERKLWYDFLAQYPVKFYRQKIIGEYIADFYSRKASLVIELDGSQHYTEEGQDKDMYKKQFIEQYDIIVLHFSNLEIEQNFRGICTQIDLTVKSRVAKSTQKW